MKNKLQLLGLLINNAKQTLLPDDVRLEDKSTDKLIQYFIMFNGEPIFSYSWTINDGDDIEEAKNCAAYGLMRLAFTYGLRTAASSPIQNDN